MGFTVLVIQIEKHLSFIAADIEYLICSEFNRFQLFPFLLQNKSLNQIFSIAGGIVCMQFASRLSNGLVICNLIFM